MVVVGSRPIALDKVEELAEAYHTEQDRDIDSMALLLLLLLAKLDIHN